MPAKYMQRATEVPVASLSRARVRPMQGMGRAGVGTDAVLMKDK